MFKSSLLVSLLFATFLVTPVGAQTTPPSRAITLDSLMKSGTRQFDKLDLNHDGIIDEAEWNAYVEAEIVKLRARMAKRHSETDSNGDGKISKEEYLASRAKWFADVDADNSGAIDSEKIRQYNYRRARTGQ